MKASCFFLVIKAWTENQFKCKVNFKMIGDILPSLIWTRDKDNYAEDKILLKPDLIQDTLSSGYIWGHCLDWIVMVGNLVPGE